MTISSLPVFYFIALFLTVVSAAFGLSRLHRSWAPPYLATLGTFFAWYLVEPIYSPETMEHFASDHVDTAYFIASAYILLFNFLFFTLRPAFEPRGRRLNLSIRQTLVASGAQSPEKLAYITIALWLVLLAYGTSRLGGDIIQALFPLDARAGVSMWQRHAASQAGLTGFIVSSAGYLYVLALAVFGVLLVIVRKPRLRVLLVIVIMISWPYAFMQGSRNVALFVAVPMLIAIFMIARLKPALKIAIMGAAFIAIEFAFRIIIATRNTGFDFSSIGTTGDQRHLGLNMGSELIWTVTFLDQKAIEISYGGEYIAQALNFVPRAIWPTKPILGLDYAIARGMGGAIDNDIGLIATISTGNIGQGVQNFGLFLGPIAAALLMAIWANILNRFRLQGGTERISLFLLGLALTFNLGRDITLLVLFPFVFGYIAVRILESTRKVRMGIKVRGTRNSSTLANRTGKRR